MTRRKKIAEERYAKLLRLGRAVYRWDVLYSNTCKHRFDVVPTVSLSSACKVHCNLCGLETFLSKGACW